MRPDGEEGELAFDNMRNIQLNGTTGWTSYSIQLPLNPKTRTIVLGVRIAGSGHVWADDLELLIDGRPVWEAPKKDQQARTL